VNSVGEFLIKLPLQLGMLRLLIRRAVLGLTLRARSIVWRLLSSGSALILRS